MTHFSATDIINKMKEENEKAREFDGRIEVSSYERGYEVGYAGRTYAYPCGSLGEDDYRMGHEDGKADRARAMAERTRHNHLTRDIKALGQCPACDETHERSWARTSGETV